jgi:hypothetical protein
MFWIDSIFILLNDLNPGYILYLLLFVYIKQLKYKIKEKKNILIPTMNISLTALKTHKIFLDHHCHHHYYY